MVTYITMHNIHMVQEWLNMVDLDFDQDQPNWTKFILKSSRGKKYEFPMEWLPGCTPAGNPMVGYTGQLDDEAAAHVDRMFDLVMKGVNPDLCGKCKEKKGEMKKCAGCRVQRYCRCGPGQGYREHEG